MANPQGKKSGGAKKHGRNKDKCAAYRAHNTRTKHKLVKIAHSNGPLAVKSYQHDPGAEFPQEYRQSKAVEGKAE